MTRYLTSKLIEKLRDKEYKTILKCVNDDPELSLEVRVSSAAIIYYKKSKILSIFPRLTNPKLLSIGYWEKDVTPILDLENPQLYFDYAKALVNSHTGVKKNEEFAIQQKILADNNSDKNSFLVVDMEYQFAQNIIKERTKKKTRFDLVAINPVKNSVILFELKQGMSSSAGNSGVLDHKNKFDEHHKHTQFRDALISDIISIVKHKGELGIFDFDTKPIIANLYTATIEFNVIFAYSEANEMLRYKSRFGKHVKTLYVNRNSSSLKLTESNGL
jgi:hypothetical protein